MPRRLINLRPYRCKQYTFTAKRDARKQANDADKAEKAAADNQARIERLQSELDKLKKDE